MLDLLHSFNLGFIPASPISNSQFGITECGDRVVFRKGLTSREQLPVMDDSFVHIAISAYFCFSNF
jgi:hypothetical protein